MNLIHKKFTESLLNWFEIHGRKNLPWQQPRAPYRVWVSEIMLQQTQVKTVIPYFLRFMERFPDIKALADATEDEVFSHWAGLGYYRRARYLHQTAKIITQQFNQQFPQAIEQLYALPGIGRSTASAIASLAFNQPTAILDGNVKRVLSRYFRIEGTVDNKNTEQHLWQLADQCMSQTRCAEYSQAIMDLGATCCTPKQPTCQSCPLNANCAAFLENVVMEYPKKKKKVILPSKHQQFLILYTPQKQFYLEKRPPIGIWGGLWSLPQIELAQSASGYVDEKHQLQVQKQQTLMTFKHTFSHFHLHLTAIALECEEVEPEKDSVTALHVAETNGQWFTMQAIQKLGLPKPIHTIFQYFLSKNDQFNL